MSTVTVRQSITADGRVRVEVANTSGQDAEKLPCSIVFSLRSSHPHFFYCWSGGLPYDGANSGSPLQPRHHEDAATLLAENGRLMLQASEAVWAAHSVEALDPDLVPPLPYLPEGERGGGYGGGRTPTATSDELHGGPGASHRTGDALTSLAMALHPRQNGSSDSVHGAPPRSLVARSLAERPLLLREYLPDGVLLPGETRTFHLSVDDPAYVAELVARGEALPRSAPPHRREPALTRAGVGADVRGRGSHDSTGAHVAGRAVNFAADTAAAPSTRREDSDLAEYELSGAGATKVFTAEEEYRTGSSGAPPWERRGTRHSHSSGRGGSYGDDYEDDESTFLRATPPLSITRDSAPRDSRVSGRGGPVHAPAPGAGLHFSFSSLPSDSARSDTALGEGARGSSAHGGAQEFHVGNSWTSGGSLSPHADGAPCAPADVGWDRSLPRPILYVFYERLGDEGRCVESARAWLKKEARKYEQWQEKYIAAVVKLERRRRARCGLAVGVGVVSASGRTHDGLNGSYGSAPGHESGGAHPALSRGMRVIPPALGESVRWTRENGYARHRGIHPHGANAHSQAAYCASAFHYYYGLLCDSVDGHGGGTASGAARTRPSLVGFHLGDLNRGSVATPPLFDSVHAHPGVSKMAQKMFSSSRMGAGTVSLFLRGRRQKRLHSALKTGWFEPGGRPGSRGDAPPPGLASSAAPGRGAGAALEVRPDTVSHRRSTVDPLVSLVDGKSGGPRRASEQGPTDFLVSASRERQVGGEDVDNGSASDPMLFRQATAVPGPLGDSVSTPHARIRSGRGLALLDDGDHPLAWDGGPPGSAGAVRAAFVGGRTHTLDPATAAAMVHSLPYAPTPSSECVLDNSSESAATPYVDVSQPIELQASSNLFPLSAIRSEAHATRASEDPLGAPVTSAAGAKSSPSSLPQDSPDLTDSFVDLSLSTLHRIVSFWKPKLSDEVEESEGGAAEAGSPTGDRTGSSGLTRGTANRNRVLTAVPPSTLYAGPARGGPQSATGVRTSDLKLSEGRSPLASAAQVSRTVAELTALASNGAAAVATEGARHVKPIASATIDFLVNHVFGSAVPQAAAAVVSFAQDVALTPSNVSIMVYTVMPVVMVISGVLLILSLFTAAGPDAGIAAGADFFYRDGEYL